MLNKIKSLTKKGGFTLLEMLVVVAIFGILTAILVFNYGNFSDNTLATNMAYEIALQVREAQVFGLGVRSSGTSFNDSFDNAYGVYINVPAGSNSNSMIFFLDSNADTECDGAGGAACTCSGDAVDECIESKNLLQGIKFTDLQVSDGTTCTEIESLAISFKRPNPDALIRINGDPTAYQLAQIQITAPRSGENRYVIVRDTGQISVSRDSECVVSVGGGDSGGGDPGDSAPIDGCTDPTADNYDSGATNDDGSCTSGGGDPGDSAPIDGCTDPTADNYDSGATNDDGSCTYGSGDPGDSAPIDGCTDPTADNYDPSATSDDGSCYYPSSDVQGCTDPTADNYDSGANVDDGSCTYGSGSGSGSYGCTDPTADNYDSGATSDDGSCTYGGSGSMDSFGCTDSGADNYNPNANIDDGSCTYGSGSGSDYYGCTDPSAYNYDSNATTDDGSCMY